jgi:excisionase family DNA binding protein
MKTYDLKQAADILKMTTEGLRRMIVQGTIPAVKPGKRWCIREDDLAQYLLSLYPTNANRLQGVIERRETWHSTEEVKFGGLRSATLEEKYNKVLEP